jgi:hypothetical protein
MKTLDRRRLDLANKTRSNIFEWRGQFTPEFVEYLLDEANEGRGGSEGSGEAARGQSLLLILIHRSNNGGQCDGTNDRS